MKTLKLIIFFSSLGSTFIIIYRQSNDRGLIRLWRSFKIAILACAIWSGLIPTKIEAIEFNAFNNSTHIERLASNHDLNSSNESNLQITLVKASDTPSSVPTPIRRQPNNFPTGKIGGRIPSSNLYRTPPKLSNRQNPAGANNGNEPGQFDDEHPVTEKKQKSRTGEYPPNYPENKKKSKEEDQCSIDGQNKAGIDTLPDSVEFTYNLETKTAKKALKKVWKNPEAKKEVLDGLDKMNKGELLPRNQKDFKGFKTLKEIKLTNTRMIVKPGKNGVPDEIVAIVMKRDLKHVAKIFKSKYK